MRAAFAGTLVCLLTPMLAAQSPEGWLHDDTSVAGLVIQAGSISETGTTQTIGDAPAVPPPPPGQGFAGTSSGPDEVTPEIAALTQGVINGPGAYSAYQKCFLFVTNQIEYEHYYGCKKGALLTYLERKGSDADLAALLVAMLHSAGYTARYGYGMVAYRAAGNTSGVPMHIQDWLGVPLDNPIMATYCGQRGFPAFYTDGGDWRLLHRVWVEVNLSGTWYELDPAVKRRLRIAPALNDVAGLSGYSRAGLEGAAQGTVTASPNSIAGVNYPSLSTYLAGRTNQLLSSIDTNQHSTDALSLLGGWRQEPFLLADGSQLRFIGSIQPASAYWAARQSYDTLPASLLSTVKVEVLRVEPGTPVVASYTAPMANLQGRRLSLTFTDKNAALPDRAQLWLDDTVPVGGEETTAALGTTVKLRITIDHPHNVGGSTTLHDQTTTPKICLRGARYALTYSFNPTAELLKARQNQLDAYRRTGLADDSREVVTETLNVIGLTWLHQTELMERALGGKTNCDPLYHHRIGRVSQENGYYIDVDGQFDGIFSLDGNAALQGQVYNAANYFASAMEHGVIEQMQGAANPAVSTVKLLRLGQQQGAGSQKTFYANSTASWDAIYDNGGAGNLLQGYSSDDLTKLQGVINQGGEVLVPQKGNINLNQWTGAGYIVRSTSGGATTTGMMISGNLQGGYASFPGYVSAPYVATFSNSNPVRINTTPITIAPTLSFDPIDLASGDYVFSSTDLEVGAAAPRGFTFSRQYHGGRSRVNPTGLGYGWTHNWQVRAVRRSAYEPALGLGGTSYDVAGTIVAACAALDLASVAPDAQHWTLAGLTAHWLTDQLQDNAVSISIGERSLQFVRRADGVWQPPGGVTMTLAASGVTGFWVLGERHGNTYYFDSMGRLANVVDLWGKTLNVAYVADKVFKVTDAYNRTLTFNYTGSQLHDVTDDIGRSVNFTYNGNDLATVSDPEGKADRYAYDGEHRITEVRNHDNEIVATNIYDATGRIIAQNSEGNPAKKWRYYYFLNSSVEVNPLGGQTTYFFDSRKRQTGQQDAAGRISSTTYDGQDRVTETKTPLGRKTTRAYDRYQNLTSVLDPDLKQTFFDYDGQQQLWRIRDPLTHTNVYTFNAQHQPLTIANGENEQTVNTYNAASGTIATTTLPGAPAATTFEYNARDELWKTHFPSRGTETITRYPAGDPQNVQDARLNTTSYTYNLRRQVLMVTRPGQPASVNIYNNQRELASATDARGKITTFNTYSPTGKLLLTTLPGGATITDTYDLRDWHATTTAPKLPTEAAQTTTFHYLATGELSGQDDPLTRPTSFGYDNDRRPTRTEDALSHGVTTDYNGRGLVNSSIDPLSHGATYDHDDAGRRTGFHNRRHQLFTFGYDNADRLLSTTTPNGRISAQTYNNGRGLADTITEPSTQQTVLTYDARGRVATRTDGTGAITYGYDDNSNLRTVLQAGLTITRTYDALNRVDTYNDGRGHTLGYGYDNNGNLTSLTYEAGKTVTYVYDGRNRLTDITDWTGRHTVLSYDGAGRLVSVMRPNGTVRTNTWDDAGQLKAVMDKHTASGKPVLAIKLGYDLAGRLTDKAEYPNLGAAVTPPARSATYNNDNQLTVFNGLSITSDLDGNITSAPAPNTAGPLASYTWNSRNQLTASPNGLSYSYDAEGMRLSFTQAGQSTAFVNDPQGPMSRVLWRIRPDGTRTFYICGPILLYEIEETAGGGNPANAARYYHYDHLGSTIALSNEAGIAVARANYSTYGITIQTSGTLNTPFLWQGAFGVQTDTNGLHHMRARYYQAYIGRFLSEDPLGLSAAPNVYAYCNGNPITSNDPLGLCTQSLPSVLPQGPGLIFHNADGSSSFSPARSDVSSIIYGFNKLTSYIPRPPAWLESFANTVNQTGGVGLGPVSAVAPAGRTAYTAVSKLWPVASEGRQIINGIEYTTHALERMSPVGLIQKGGEIVSRGVPPSVVENAIRFGKVTPGNTAAEVVRTYENVRVITNPEGTKVISVIKTSN